MANSDETTIDDFLVISNTLETATANKDVLTLNARVKLVFVIFFFFLLSGSHCSFFFDIELFPALLETNTMPGHGWPKLVLQIKLTSSTDKIVPLCDPSYAWNMLLSRYLAQPSSREVPWVFKHCKGLPANYSYSRMTFLNYRNLNNVTNVYKCKKEQAHE